MKNLLLVFLLFVSGFAVAQPRFDVVSAENFQQDLTMQYADPTKSPLTTEDLKNFHGLQFFPVSADYYINAKFIRTDDEKAFEMKTSTDRRPLYRKYGELHFTIAGKACKLNLYQNIENLKIEKYRNSLFLPFSDLTSGNETYIGGRYIDMTIPEGDTVAIDFNRAYNPYCAYNPKYSCPAVPLENDLPVAIKAGVKTFHE